ncbi:DUF2911 domain-containing protein [Rapidithrix thailandica]|uniref:DUF2911 domain-containing protein n=1 Tax=Rapidithrix thailandica TaxID=413964 RepID=A0AAW9SAA2_9BACT
MARVFGLLILISGFLCQVVIAQEFETKPRKYPVGMSNYKEGGNYIKVTYGRPKLRYERSLTFGYNVPYGKIWRTGADDATEITFSQRVKLFDQELEPGTYTLFTIPDQETWTVILNSEPGQWGLYKYDPAKDVLRQEVPLYKPPKVFQEFTIHMQKSEKGVDIVVLYERISIRLPVEFIEE